MAAGATGSSHTGTSATGSSHGCSLLGGGSPGTSVAVAAWAALWGCRGQWRWAMTCGAGAACELASACRRQAARRWMRSGSRRVLGKLFSPGSSAVQVAQAWGQACALRCSGGASRRGPEARQHPLLLCHVPCHQVPSLTAMPVPCHHATFLTAVPCGEGTAMPCLLPPCYITCLHTVSLTSTPCSSHCASLCFSVSCAAQSEAQTPKQPR